MADINYKTINPSPSFSKETYEKMYNSRNKDLVSALKKMANSAGFTDQNFFTDNPLIFHTGFPEDFNDLLNEGDLRIFNKGRDYIINAHGLDGGYISFGDAKYEAATISELLQQNDIIPKDAENIYMISCFGGQIKPETTHYGASVSSAHTFKDGAIYGWNAYDSYYFANAPVSKKFAETEAKNGGRWNLYKSQDSQELQSLKSEITDYSVRGRVKNGEYEVVAPKIEHNDTNSVSDENIINSSIDTESVHTKDALEEKHISDNNFTEPTLESQSSSKSELSELYNKYKSQEKIIGYYDEAKLYPKYSTPKFESKIDQDLYDKLDAIYGSYTDKDKADKLVSYLNDYYNDLDTKDLAYIHGKYDNDSYYSSLSTGEQRLVNETQRDIRDYWGAKNGYELNRKGHFDYDKEFFTSEYERTNGSSFTDKHNETTEQIVNETLKDESEIKQDISNVTSETSEKIAEESAEETLENTAKETTEESINDVAEEAVEDTASKMETKTVSDAARASIGTPPTSGGPSSGSGLPTWAKIGIAAAGVIAVGALIKNKDKKEKEAPRQNLSTKMAIHPMYSPSNYTNNDQQLAQGISRYRYGRTG